MKRLSFLLVPTLLLFIAIVAFTVATDQNGEVRVFGNTQEIESGVPVAVVFHSEDFDTLGAFEPSDTRLYFARSATCYLHARAWFKNLGSGTKVSLTIRVNGEYAYAGDNATSSASDSSQLLNASTLYKFSAGDYIEAIAQHDNDTPVQINSNIMEAFCN